VNWGVSRVFVDQLDFSSSEEAGLNVQKASQGRRLTKANTTQVE